MREKGKIFVIRAKAALGISILLSAQFGCRGELRAVQEQPVKKSSTSNTGIKPGASQITREGAVATAKGDYLRLRGTLKDYVVEESEREKEWRVVVRLRIENLMGVGAVYLIDKETGKIRERKIFQ